MSGVLGLLGLGARAGALAVGVAAVRDEVRRGGCHCVVVAADASPRAVEKVMRLVVARAVPQVAGPDAATLGARLGRPPVMVVGVRDPKLASGILRAATGPG
ncbi:MAG: ribosomal L7Ae/L30e/S12e/Gadd45 family protein [Gemmatimonadales bacterium]|nr:ribosomal L7Ae/L30e/S12e/Gadd45 family protein [Gemmatimonadales bacterium]